MKQISLEDFLSKHGWSDSLKAKLREASQDPAVKSLVAWDNAGILSASAFTSTPDEWPANSVSIWSKDNTKSRTMLAVDLVERDNLTVYAAAKQVGLNQSAVHRAIKRRAVNEICPHCNQVIRPPLPR